MASNEALFLASFKASAISFSVPVSNNVLEILISKPKKLGNITIAKFSTRSKTLPKYPMLKPFALMLSCCSGKAISGKYEL